MQIWPAIDLRGGKCVRLRQGDYGRETVYGDDPAAMAKNGSAKEPSCLHLVDLDGARDGSNANLAAVKAIVKAVSVPCELGGGIRDEGTIEKMLSLGLSRLVVGTRALKEPDWFRTACRPFPASWLWALTPKRPRRHGRLAGNQRNGRHRPGPHVRRRAAGRHHLHRHLLATACCRGRTSPPWPK